jgi:hypothetical protein
MKGGRRVGNPTAVRAWINIGYKTRKIGFQCLILDRPDFLFKLNSKDGAAFL